VRQKFEHVRERIVGPVVPISVRPQQLYQIRFFSSAWQNSPDFASFVNSTAIHQKLFPKSDSITSLQPAWV
jgi:hypothetical protein